MDSTRIQELFKTIGKLLYLADVGATASSTIEAAISAVQVQNAGAVEAANPYLELQNFTSPLLQQSLSITQATDRVGTLTDTAIANYLRAVAVELNLANTASAAAAATALAGAMQTSGDTVAPSGTYWSYFDDTLGATLPMNASPSIPDEWVEVTIV